MADGHGTDRKVNVGKIFWGRFRDGESGAVTVDWVVLTAAMLIMGITVVATILGGATDMTTGIGARLSDAKVPTVEFP